MDWVVAFITNPVTERVTAYTLLTAVIVMILTGKLMPIWQHRRELAAANARGDEHKQASDKKDEAMLALMQQNATLLAGVRIADKFYGDFLPEPLGNTGPAPGVQHVEP